MKQLVDERLESVGPSCPSSSKRPLTTNTGVYLIIIDPVGYQSVFSAPVRKLIVSGGR